jgi:hypothetical protein
MYYVTAECPYFSQSRGLGLMYYVRAGLKKISFHVLEQKSETHMILHYI